MPRPSGVAATREITARPPAARIVVLSTFDDDELVFEAIKAGAHAYLLKDASEADVSETIGSVHRGESRLSPSIARKVMEQFRTLVVRQSETLIDDTEPTKPNRSVTTSTADRNPKAGSAVPSVRDEALTDKQSRILDLLAQGMSNKQIAAAAFLAEGTVKNYVSRIMEKLHASSRLELAVRVFTRRS
jgi:DNA-binding NarL/FixJ family response regulator